MLPVQVFPSISGNSTKQFPPRHSGWLRKSQLDVFPKETRRI